VSQRVPNLSENEKLTLTVNRLQRQIKRKHDLAMKYQKLWQEDSAALMQVNCVLRQVTGKNWFEMVADGTARELVLKHIKQEPNNE